MAASPSPNVTESYILAGPNGPNVPRGGLQAWSFYSASPALVLLLEGLDGTWGRINIQALKKKS